MPTPYEPNSIFITVSVLLYESECWQVAETVSIRLRHFTMGAYAGFVDFLARDNLKFLDLKLRDARQNKFEANSDNNLKASSPGARTYLKDVSLLSSKISSKMEPSREKKAAKNLRYKSQKKQSRKRYGNGSSIGCGGYYRSGKNW